MKLAALPRTGPLELDKYPEAKALILRAIEIIECDRSEDDDLGTHLGGENRHPRTFRLAAIVTSRADGGISAHVRGSIAE